MKRNKEPSNGKVYFGIGDPWDKDPLPIPKNPVIKLRPAFKDFAYTPEKIPDPWLNNE